MEIEGRPRLPGKTLHWRMPVDRRMAKAVYAYHVAMTEHSDDVEQYNSKLLRLVEVCDEKADTMPSDITGFDPELRWVPVARLAFQSVGVNHTEIAEHGKAILFSDHSMDVDIQRELYHEMCRHLSAEHWSVLKPNQA